MSSVETEIDIGITEGKWPTVVLKNAEGNIIARLMLHTSVAQLELFIGEAYRGQHKWTELANVMKQCAENCKPYYAISTNEKVAFMCKTMGMKELEGTRVFVME